MFIRQSLPVLSKRNWLKKLGELRDLEAYSVIEKGLSQVFDANTWDARQVELTNLIQIISNMENNELMPLLTELKLFHSVISYASSINLPKLDLLQMREDFIGEEKIDVIYLDEVAREQYRVIPYNGMLWELRNTDDELHFQPFRTRLTSRFSINPENINIFVFDPVTKNFFFGEERQYNHSSFVCGAPVLMAGEAIVEDGKIVKLTNKSGHYLPDLERFFEMIYLFNQLGLLDEKVKLIEEESKKTFKLEDVINYIEEKNERERLIALRQANGNKKDFMLGGQIPFSDIPPARAKNISKRPDAVNRKRLDDLQILLHNVIYSLTAKQRSLPEDHDDSQIIDGIIGNKKAKNSLHHLYNKIEKHKKNLEQNITDNTIADLATEFSHITRSKILKNPNVKQQRKNETFFQRLGRRVLDGLIRFVSQHTMDSALSTVGLFKDVGKHTLKSLSLFAPKTMKTTKKRTVLIDEANVKLVA